MVHFSLRIFWSVFYKISFVDTIRLFENYRLFCYLFVFELDLLKRSAPSRIIVVASELYRLSSLNLENINPTTTFPAYLYYVSKYADIVFTLELARRLKGTGVTANCLHPGMVDSGIWKSVPAPLSWGLYLIVKGFFKTPEQGAQTTIHLAVSDEVSDVTGKYFLDCHVRSTITKI